MGRRKNVEVVTVDFLPSVYNDINDHSLNRAQRRFIKAEQKRLLRKNKKRKHKEKPENN